VAVAFVVGAVCSGLAGFFGMRVATSANYRTTNAARSGLNEALATGKIDLGLVSSYEYAQGDYFLLPDVSISATGRVGSVLLFSRVPLDQLSGEEVVLTKASATSVALLKLLLEDFCGQRPRYRMGSLADLAGAAAYLAIGDEALRLRHHPPFQEAYDLATLWMEHTGLPFVFAVFAVRKEAWREKAAAIRDFAQALYLSRARGLAALTELANQCVRLSGLSSGECLLYLKGIEYDLSGLKQEALRVFFQHLLRRKEVKRPHDLHFVDL
jgi:chorismate dehydratase